MGKYRKKPVVIEAFQMTRERREDNSEWPNWAHEAWNFNADDVGSISVDQRINRDVACDLNIRTLEGPLAVSYDDWIIRGVKGELYPCKPDIFEATYEPAE